MTIHDTSLYFKFFKIDIEFILTPVTICLRRLPLDTKILFYTGCEPDHFPFQRCLKLTEFAVCAFHLARQNSKVLYLPFFIVVIIAHINNTFLKEDGDPLRRPLVLSTKYHDYWNSCARTKFHDGEFNHFKANNIYHSSLLNTQEEYILTTKVEL